jgi:hypothetical protein
VWTSTRILRHADTSRLNTKTAEIVEGSIFVICPTHLTRIIAILTRYIVVRDFVCVHVCCKLRSARGVYERYV